MLAKWIMLLVTLLSSVTAYLPSAMAKRFPRRSFYLRDTSTSTEASPLSVATLRNLELTNADGKKVKLSNLMGTGKSVVLFLR